MESKWKDVLEKHAKDKKSYEKLRTLFDELREEKDRYARDLRLLENAIKDDYDSILITELNLEEPGPRIVYVNDGFTKMTGYSREEVIGKTPRILQGPKTDRSVLDKLKKRLQEGKSFFGQTVNYRKDGSEFVNQWDIHPLTDEEGNITHWVSYQHDITERKRAEKTLMDTRSEFDALREASRQTVVDVSLEGDVVMANKAFRKLIGYDKDELKKLKVWELFPRKYRDSLKARFDQGANGERFGDQQFKGLILHKSGIPIQIEGRTRLMELKDQVLIRARIHNISLQKRIIDTLNRRIKNYEEIVEKASEFTYRLQVIEDDLVFESLSEDFPIITGVSPEAAKSEGGYKEFIHSDDLEKVKSHYREVLKGKSCTCTYRIHTRDDSFVEIVDYSRPEWDSENEEVVRIMGAVTLKTADRASG